MNFSNYSPGSRRNYLYPIRSDWHYSTSVVLFQLSSTTAHSSNFLRSDITALCRMRQLLAVGFHRFWQRVSNQKIQWILSADTEEKLSKSSEYIGPDSKPVRQDPIQRDSPGKRELNSVFYHSTFWTKLFNSWKELIAWIDSIKEKLKRKAYHTSTLLI
jgi:hypothetical protein